MSGLTDFVGQLVVPGSSAEAATAFVLLAVCGLLSAAVNSIAGGGSLLVLPALIALGLPPGIANGSARLGVFTASLASTLTFHSRGVEVASTSRLLLAPMAIGTLAGSWLATRIPDADLQELIGVVLIAWAVILVVRPGRFLTSLPTPKAIGWGTRAIVLVIGVYGGFLQAGVGFPLLALLVSGLGHDPLSANAVKVRLVFVSSIVALFVFTGFDKFAPKEAVAVALGSAVGGWLGTRLQLRAGATFVHVVVTLMVAASGLAMLLR